MSTALRGRTLLPVLLVLAAGAGAAPVAFEVATVQGKPTRAAIVRLTEKWELRLTGEDRSFGPAEWVSLRQLGAALPPPPADAHLFLTSGDRVPVTPTSLALVGERLSFSCPWLAGGKASRLPLAALALIWRSAPDGIDDAGAFQRRLLATPRRRDAVILRNGDVLEGVLIRLDGRGLVVQVNRKPVQVEMAQLSAIVLSSVLALGAQPKELHGKLVLTDGSRFTLLSASSDGRTLAGTTPQGSNLEVPLERIAALDLLQGQATYLSDLKPLRYEHTPYLGVIWPLVVDASVAGRSLLVGGNCYDRGLGLHSAARVSYAIPSGASRFEAIVGLDDATGRKGSVVLRVLIDGKEREIGGGERPHRAGPLAIRLDLAGGRELTLVVEFGAGGDIGDHVNWANARFIR